MSDTTFDGILMAIMALLLTLAVFGIAGNADFEDRTQGLGADMMPSEGWVQEVRG